MDRSPLDTLRLDILYKYLDIFMHRVGLAIGSPDLSRPLQLWQILQE